MNLPNHQLTMTVLMTPDKTNFFGNVHGGDVLKLLDQVAIFNNGTEIERISGALPPTQLEQLINRHA